MNVVRLLGIIALIGASNALQADPKTTSLNVLRSKFTWSNLRTQFIIDNGGNANNVQAFAYGNWLVKDSRG